MTSGLRTGFRPSNVQAKVTQGPTPSQTPNPLSASSGLTYRGSPITPTPHTFGGFPTSDKGNDFESSSDTFSGPTKSASQTVLKAVNPRVVCVTLMPSVTTMSNSRSYPVTPVALQHCSSTPVALTYSGHGHTVILPLRTTLGLIPIQSLLHLAVYPALT